MDNLTIKGPTGATTDVAPDAMFNYVRGVDPTQPITVYKNGQAQDITAGALKTWLVNQVTPPPPAAPPQVNMQVDPLGQMTPQQRSDFYKANAPKPKANPTKADLDSQAWLKLADNPNTTATDALKQYMQSNVKPAATGVLNTLNGVMHGGPVGGLVAGALSHSLHDDNVGGAALGLVGGGAGKAAGYLPGLRGVLTPAQRVVDGIRATVPATHPGVGRLAQNLGQIAGQNIGSSAIDGQNIGLWPNVLAVALGLGDAGTVGLRNMMQRSPAAQTSRMAEIISKMLGTTPEELSAQKSNPPAPQQGLADRLKDFLSSEFGSSDVKGAAQDLGQKAAKNAPELEQAASVASSAAPQITTASNYFAGPGTSPPPTVDATPANVGRNLQAMLDYYKELDRKRGGGNFQPGQLLHDFFIKGINNFNVPEGEAQHYHDFIDKAQQIAPETDQLLGWLTRRLKQGNSVAVLKPEEEQAIHAITNKLGIDLPDAEDFADQINRVRARFVHGQAKGSAMTEKGTRQISVDDALDHLRKITAVGGRAQAPTPTMPTYPGSIQAGYERPGSAPLADQPVTASFDSTAPARAADPVTAAFDGTPLGRSTDPLTAAFDKSPAARSGQPVQAGYDSTPPPRSSTPVTGGFDVTSQYQKQAQQQLQALLGKAYDQSNRSFDKVKLKAILDKVTPENLDLATGGRAGAFRQLLDDYNEVYDRFKSRSQQTSGPASKMGLLKAAYGKVDLPARILRESQIPNSNWASAMRAIAANPNAPRSIVAAALGSLLGGETDASK